MNTPNKDLLGIRLNHLEEDCQTHPRMAYDWNLELAGARRNAADAENRLKLAFAETADAIRRDPAAFGLDEGKRPSEDAIKQTVLLQASYQDYQDQKVRADYEVGVLEAFSWALVDRKKMLESEVQLHGQTYFSKPNTSADTPAGRTGTMKRAAGGVGGKDSNPKRRSV